MRNWLNNEKGSMTVYSIVTILSFIFIISALFMGSASVRKSQLKTMPKIKEVYEQDLEYKYGIYNQMTTEFSYSIINNGNIKYYATLKSAYDDVINNGKDNSGGTIFLQKNVTEDTTGLQMNKTVTIDLQSNTMQINKTINVTAGTLTIRGTGTIKSADGSTKTFNQNGGKVNVVGGARLQPSL